MKMAEENYQSGWKFYAQLERKQTYKQKIKRNESLVSVFVYVFLNSVFFSPFNVYLDPYKQQSHI